MCSSDLITLEQELDLAKSFLGIERVRFGDRLRIETELDPECMRCPAPPLLIQPLVENAITHGVAPLIEGGVVRITARRVESCVEVEVENPCDPDRGVSRGAGVGLRNVRERLQNIYGREAFVASENRGNRFTVQVRWPCALS